ncbi:MAG: excisionase family DNA-binding protein [Lewinella sp.]|uniref:excisionase family DNA-binding protein n=1 Tax=Lewinella sp. TaxID=2004506 RepID=UPI003D6B00A5
MLSIRSIAVRLDVSTRTIVRMHKDGKIRLYRLGGKLFAKYDELKEDLEAALDPVLSNS